MKKLIIALLLAVVSIVANGQTTYGETRYFTSLYRTPLEFIDNYEKAVRVFSRPIWKEVLEYGTTFKFSKTDSDDAKLNAHTYINKMFNHCINLIEKQSKKDGIVRDTSKLKKIAEYHKKEAEFYKKVILEEKEADRRRLQEEFSNSEKELFGW